jgi:hypothetical protein
MKEERLSEKDKEMLTANSMKAIRDGESKKAFLKNTKFIIDGMVSNNYDLQEEVIKLQQENKDLKAELENIRLKQERYTRFLKVLDDKGIEYYDVNRVIDKLDKIKEKIKDYNCIYNKGFPYNKLLVIHESQPSNNQYLELEVVMNDFNSIIESESE